MFSNSLAVMLRLLSFLVLGLLSSSHPIDRVLDLEDNRDDQSVSDTPKWYNHCKVTPESSYRLSHKVSESKSVIIINEMLQKVEKSALISMRRAEDVKRKFVSFISFSMLIN